jgi:hypothetical protein
MSWSRQLVDIDQDVERRILASGIAIASELVDSFRVLPSFVGIDTDSEWC